MPTPVQAALIQVLPSNSAFAVTLVDQLLLQPGQSIKRWRPLAAGHANYPIPQYRDSQGYPTIFDGQLIGAVLALDWESRGMKKITDRYRGQIYYLPVEIEISLRDMDMPQDCWCLLEIPTQ